jgi:hypothetical protein
MQNVIIQFRRRTPLPPPCQYSMLNPIVEMLAHPIETTYKRPRGFHGSTSPLWH